MLSHFTLVLLQRTPDTAILSSFVAPVLQISASPPSLVPASNPKSKPRCCLLQWPTKYRWTLLTLTTTFLLSSPPISFSNKNYPYAQQLLFKSNGNSDCSVRDYRYFPQKNMARSVREPFKDLYFVGDCLGYSPVDSFQLDYDPP